MIRTDQTETVPCEDCDGTGKAPTTHHCPGCDHQHAGFVDCEWCEGAGTRTYPVWIPDPENCHYCANGVAHPMFWAGFWDLQVKRGPIEFHPVTDEAP